MPGTVVLPDVPLFDGAVELSAIRNHPRIVLSLMVERPGLFRVSRESVQDGFNIRQYRTNGDPSSPLLPYLTFANAVSSVIVSRDRRGSWKVDNPEDERVVDRVSMEAFVMKIAEVGVSQQATSTKHST